MSFRAHLAAINGLPQDDRLSVIACVCLLSEMRKKMFTLVVTTVCKQINNEYAPLPKGHTFSKTEVSSLSLTCRKPRREHAPLKLFRASYLMWAEPTQTTAPVFFCLTHIHTNTLKKIKKKRKKKSWELSSLQDVKKKEWMVKHRHGPNWAETQNKLKRAWLSAGSPLCLPYWEWAWEPSDEIKKKKWRKKLNTVEQASVFGWGCHGDRVHGCR